MEKIISESIFVKLLANENKSNSNVSFGMQVNYWTSKPLSINRVHKRTVYWTIVWSLNSEFVSVNMNMSP